MARHLLIVAVVAFFLSLPSLALAQTPPPEATVVVGPAIPPAIPAIQEVNGVFILPEIPAAATVAPRTDRGRDARTRSTTTPIFALPPPPPPPPLPPALVSPMPIMARRAPPPVAPPPVANIPVPPTHTPAALPTDRAINVVFGGFTGLAVRARVCVMGPTRHGSGKGRRSRRRGATTATSRCVSWIPFGQEIVPLAYPAEWGQNPTVRIVGGPVQDTNMYSWTGPLGQSRVNAILIERITQRRHVHCDRAGICG